MPGLTFPIVPEGLCVPVLIGYDADLMQAMQVAGTPLPLPRQARALIDTGCAITAIVPSLITSLGLVAAGWVQTQTASGGLYVQYYQVSLTLYDAASPGGVSLFRPVWTVTRLHQDLPDVDVLIGMDLISDPAHSTLPRGTAVDRKRCCLLKIFLLFCVACGDRRLPHEGKSVSELERMLHDADTNVQCQGALGLSLHGPAALPALPALKDLLHSPAALVRQNATLALGKIGPPAREAVPDLTDLLSDKEWAVRRQAALALGEIGPEAKTALPALEKLGRDANEEVRKAAKQSVGKIRAETKR
jgi:hypothetical protein